MILRLLMYVFLCLCYSNIYAEELASNHTIFPEETRVLSQQYKALKKQPSHWKKGDWNDKVDRYRGDMHVVMEKLGELIKQNEYNKTEVMNLMGPPDAIKQKGKSEQYIYFWRNWHDYLYFTVIDDKVTGSQWYFAYE